MHALSGAPPAAARGGATDPRAADRAAMREAEIEVTVIIPCRDEAMTVEACVRDAREALDRCGYAGEVLVVDNGSMDESAAIAAAAGARVVPQPIRGYGASCLRGFEEARGKLLVIVDADGTYDLSVLHRFIEPLRAGYEMVLGTRRNGEIVPGAMRRRHRHLLEPLQTQLSRRLLRFQVSDVRCGMRAITSEAAGELHLGSTGMEFATEMLVESARAGLEVVEVPVRFRPRPDRAARRSVGDGWRVARYLLLLSPTRLFVIPGLILLLGGLLIEAALLPGPIRTPWLNFDFHFMFVGSAMALLGLQVLLLGVYAKTYALVQNRGTFDPAVLRFHLAYSLERGVAAGGALFGLGLAVNLWILFRWIAEGAGDLFAVRPAVLALTLMVLGAEIVFASFFLSLLRGSEFGRA